MQFDTVHLGVRNSMQENHCVICGDLIRSDAHDEREMQCLTCGSARFYSSDVRSQVYSD